MTASLLQEQQPAGRLPKKVLFHRGMLRYWIWVFHPIWSNISLSANKYEVQEGGNYLRNMSCGIIETIADSDHSGQHLFSPSLATKLFRPVHVRKKTPFRICKWSSPLKHELLCFPQYILCHPPALNF